MFLDFMKVFFYIMNLLIKIEFNLFHLYTFVIYKKYYQIILFAMCGESTNDTTEPIDLSAKNQNLTSVDQHDIYKNENFLHSTHAKNFVTDEEKSLDTCYSLHHDYEASWGSAFSDKNFTQVTNSCNYPVNPLDHFHLQQSATILLNDEFAFYQKQKMELEEQKSQVYIQKLTPSNNSISRPKNTNKNKFCDKWPNFDPDLFFNAEGESIYSKLQSEISTEFNLSKKSLFKKKSKKRNKHKK